MTKNVLVICTSASKLGDSGKETGCWMEEVAAPYYVWKAKGYNVTVASIQGGEIPFDDKSLNPPFLTPECEKFLLDGEAMQGVEESMKLDDVKVTDYDAFFLPGGHGVCFDFPQSDLLGKLLSEAWQAGKVVAAVCHGPNGLVNVKDASGESVVKGRKVTGFTNSEEKAVFLDDLVPFLLEDKLKELGGSFEGADDWTPNAVRDGNLVTGQNPGSSTKAAELVVEALGA